MLNGFQKCRIFRTSVFRSFSTEEQIKSVKEGETMTPKERVIAQIKHKETDFIPYTLSFDDEAGEVVERVNSYYGGNFWQDKIDNHIVYIPVIDFGIDVKSERTFSTDMYGTLWRVDKRPFHLEKPVLNKPTLSGYKFPDIEAFFDEEWYERALRLINEKKDHFLVTGFGFGLFERTWAMRGFENALIDSIANPDFYGKLVEKIAEHQMKIIDKLLTLPVDGIMFSDDWGYQQGVILGAKRWRKYLKPYLAEMYAKVHKAGRYVLSHCCGSIEEILPDVIEIGLDVYESVQPEAKNNNPYRLKRSYGKDITFWGCLGSQSIIPFGTPSKIRSEIKKLCREMGRGGGYILSPAKPIQPGTPTENVVAIIEAFLEQAGVDV